MDIQEAVLIKRILDALTGTTGMPVRQLANKLQASPRRVNHLILHLAMTGLIDILTTGKVRLSDKLAAQVCNHIEGINQKALGREYGSQWQRLAGAARVKFEQDKKRDATLFNALFGGGAQ